VLDHSFQSLLEVMELDDQEMERRSRIDAQHFGSAQDQREQALKSKIVALFQERDVTFYDCFQNLYDPLNAKASLISIS
jgi:hypothetical protein